MEKRILIELHNPSSTSNTSGVLSLNDNTLYYNEKAAITRNTYKKLLKCLCQQKRRLAIIKISYKDDCCRRHRIWRAVSTKGITGINDDCIGLPFDAIWELNATKNNNAYNTVEVNVTKGCWLPFYFFHPNHAARISTRIGLLSVLLAVCGIIISILAYCQ